MHRLLARQVKKSLGNEFKLEDLDPKLQKLLNQVSEIYIHNEEQRKSLEHIITVNSEELRNAHDDIKEKNLVLEELLEERSKNLNEQKIENKNMGYLISQYKKAMDNSLIVSLTDLEGNITFVNDNFCNITGYTKEEVINKSHNILKHPKSDKALFEELWKSIRNKEIWKGIFQNIKKNGETYYIKSTILPLLDENDEIKEYIALSDDVSKQVIYQEKLELQTQRINTIFNSQENITIIVKPKVGIIDVNHKFFQTFGFKDLNDYHEKIPCICKMFEETKLTSECGKKVEYKWFENFLETKNISNKITYFDKFANDIIFNIYCKKIYLDNEEHYLATLVDITALEHARTKAEIAEKAKSTFLANMSHEIRTPLNAIIGFSNILCESDLEKSQYEHSKIISRSAESLLEIINDVLDISKMESGKLELVYSAFEINEFMENIIELFSIKAKEKNIRFIYDVDPNIPYSVISDSTRLRQVLSNLLSNAIKFTPNYGYVKFSLNILEKSEKNILLKFIVKDDGIGISKEYQEKIFKPFSQADDGINREFGGTGLGLTICKDIITLMNSEIKINSEKSKGSEFTFELNFEIEKEFDDKINKFDDIKLGICSIKKDDEFLRSHVKNYLSKIGNLVEISKNNFSHDIDILFCFDNYNLFEKLQKFKTINPKSKIVFVGDTNIENFENISTLVNYFIDLPIYGSKIYNIISDNSKINESIIKTSNSQLNLNKHILVAEDNSNNQLLIELLLEKLGLTYVIANNGQEAVEHYKNEQFDLILMDINMPIMDGISATKEILKLQKEENYYKIPIIALTANSVAGDKEKYLNIGMDNYLSKPIIFEELKKCIESYLTI